MNYVALATALGIQGYIKGEEFRARCPLHEDRSPSFSMNIANGRLICFRGCIKGEFVDLVERVLGCAKQEATDWIQNNGRATSVAQLSRDLAAGLNLVPTLIETKDQNWYEHFFSLNNEHMPNWFLQRGFTWKTIKHWDIRYDIVRDAVVIPAYKEAELVGTIMRQYKLEPKYVNSPGIPRAEMLFGEISTRTNKIIICEGVLDAIWLWQLGHNAASIMGSFMTAHQVGVLTKHRFGEITLALDNDEAGKKGTIEAIKQLTKAGWLLPQLSKIKYWEGKKDAQDCLDYEFEAMYLDRRPLTSELLFI